MRTLVGEDLVRLLCVRNIRVCKEFIYNVRLVFQVLYYAMVVIVEELVEEDVAE